MVILPQIFQDFVFLREKRREVDEDGDRRALDFPTADTDADTLFVNGLAPVFQQVDILFELGIDSFVLQVGSDQQVMVSEFSGSGFRFGCDDGVDTADLVANFPTHFEKHVGCHFGITHIFWDFVFPICKKNGDLRPQK